jgi:hypothetical protein
MRAIDADALIGTLHNHGFYDGNERTLVYEVIQLQPTIEPEREKGAWINEGRIIRCSKCKIGYAVVKGMKSALTYNFCPNCGADMR